VLEVGRAELVDRRLEYVIFVEEFEGKNVVVYYCGASVLLLTPPQKPSTREGIGPQPMPSAVGIA
jgi:hypothetical protein